MEIKMVLHLQLMRAVFFIFFSLSVLFVSAQQKYVVCGIVTTISELPIQGVHVAVQGKNVVSKTHADGTFCIPLWKNTTYTISISHVSYKKKFITVSFEENPSDTIFLQVTLEEKTYELPLVEVKEKYSPDTIFSSTEINIQDFEFYQSYYVFLAYKKRLQKESEILLVDEHENILAKHAVPGEAEELFRDYLGRIHVLCKHAVYRIDIIGKDIFLHKLPTDDFMERIKPCVDTFNRAILFSDFNKLFPHFRYYAYELDNETFKQIKEIIDKDQDWQYHFEYYKLSNADKAYALNMAQRFKGLDKYDIAAIMTGFSNDFMYNPLYAPMFVINDTIHIFDHYESYIYKYAYDTILVDKVPINYHQPANWREWKKQVIKDDETDALYALYQKGGYYYLHTINLQNGRLEKSTKLYFQFIDKIRIKDGHVYYTYKPRESLQKKFLYREAIR